MEPAQPRPRSHSPPSGPGVVADGTPALPVTTRAAIALRMLAIQASWNYEELLGNGMGFSIEPALRRLPGGRDGVRYRQALARQSAYFNAHPYLTGIAVGAMARAELEGIAPEKIERFRTACCGPLGSVGDRLVWAGWLPFSSLAAILAFGAGAGPLVTVVIFLAIYNVGHLALRLWGLHAGWKHGLNIAAALGHPVLRQGPAYVSRAGAFVAGLGIPLAVRRVLEGGSPALIASSLAAAAVMAFVMARLHGRVEGWRLTLVLMAVFVLISILVG